MRYEYDIDRDVTSRVVNTSIIEQIKALALPKFTFLNKNEQSLEIECDSLNATQKTALDKAIKDHNPTGEITITP